MIQKKTIAFDSSKNESYTLAKVFKSLHQKYRFEHNVVFHSDELKYDKIKSYDALVIVDPQDDLTNEEVEALHQFIQQNKSLAIMGSGNENHAVTTTLTNLDLFLLKYGIKFEKDTVVRTSFFKYLHPKHVFIDDGILHQAFQECKRSASLEGEDIILKGGQRLVSSLSDDDSIDDEFDENEFTIVYPNGSSLDVNPPSFPILSSGAVSFPSSRPIAAVWDASTIKWKSGVAQVGKLLVLGSSDMFTDTWLDKEDNVHILTTLINFLVQTDANNSVFDRSLSVKNNNIDERKTVPDIEALSERLRSCLQRSEPLPQDLSSLRCTDMFGINTDLIPDVVNLYKKLKIKKEPLTIIPPQFELPIPQLKPAVFYPKLKEMPPPALEKFDLDEEFAEKSSRLAHLTNSCTDDDCDFYVQEAGSIVGLLNETCPDTDPKSILHDLFLSVSSILLSI
jgi:intraflagellar transport protein 52